jgi:imidazolonepropionase-like amidohydrolase
MFKNKLIRRLATLVTTLLLAANSFAQNPDAYLHEGPILLQNISVIDGLGHLPYPMRDVLIVDGKIQKTSVSGLIGDLPEDTYTVDGEGLTAMPGLIDLHVHTGEVNFKPQQGRGQRDPAGVQRTLNAQLYAGVTSVFDMGNSHDHIIGLRDAIANGDQVGPNIFPSGENIGSLETAGGIGGLTSPETVAEIKELLDTRQAAGIEMIKLYGGLSNWAARHIVTEAHKRGLKAVADFWCSNMGITVFRVTEMDGFAHGTCHVITDEDAEWMERNDKFAILTLTLFDNMGGHRQYEDMKTRGFLKNPLIVGPFGKETVNDYYNAAPMIREMFGDGEQSLYQTQLFGDLKHLLPDNQKNAITLHKAGVLTGLGTDADFPPGTWPGDAMHRELQLNVEAGLSPLEVIKMATYNGARILNADDRIGSLEKGKMADILIVRGDPSTDITASRNVVHVIKSGKLLDRKALVAK